MWREKVEREGVGKGGAGEGSYRPKGYLHRLEQETTTFFFSNFPEDIKELDLWHRFGRFGRVGDVYIPKKVDKQGRRFGFVKYREVSDATELLRSISDIWIGSFKLRVNRSKFSKNEQPPAKEPQAMVQRREHKFVQSEKSFKGALFDDGRVGGGKGGRALIPSEEKQGGRALILPEEKQEVVWEVEVED
jgi:RNA recognition motif-containing protein